MIKQTFVVDIDDTLLISERYLSEGVVHYKNIKPISDEIAALNKLYDNGHKIILYTGRNSNCLLETIKQLKEFGIKFHKLVMDKPVGIYIDRDAKTSLKEFV